MPVQPIDIFDLTGLQPCNMLPRPVKDARRIQPGITNMPKGIVLAEARTNANAVHTLAANGATGGTFTLTFRGFTTTVLNYNDSAAVVAAALNALPSVGAAQVVGSGTAVNGAGLVLTWSGSQVTNSPVELPVLTIVTTFLTTQPTYVSTTVGAIKGQFGPYINADGTYGTPRGLGMYRMSTDAAGNVSYASTSTGEQFGQIRQTAPIFVSGAFRIEDIPLTTITGITGGFLDAGAATTPFLKIVQGSLADSAGIIHIL